MNKATRIFVIVISVLLTAVALAACVIIIFFPPEKDYYQQLDYSESAEFFLNPDQGFYRTSGLQLFRDGTVNKSLSANGDTQVFHLRVDISDFSSVVNGAADAEFSQKNLDDLNEALKFYKEREKNVVIRFCYDKKFAGKKDQEPAVEMMMKHVKQLCSVLDKYPVTLTAIEAGFVGPWGEMHSSKAANATVINELIETFLTNTHEIPILVRTPQMIYNYLGITFDDIEGYEFPKKAYRLGMFNDGYLGSGNDLGTYMKNREKETAFIAGQTEHLPYGGEVTVPDSTWHDIDKCLPEMFLMNLSYLNYEWNTYVVQTKWKESYYTAECGGDSLYYGKSAFEYIRDHLGYRLVLKQSTFSYSKKMNKLKIKLDLNSAGFGNFYRTKNLTVYFVDGQGEVTKADAGKYGGGSTLECTANMKLSEGNYKVYLGICTIEDGKATYPVRFANGLWNGDLRANLVGNISV